MSFFDRLRSWLRGPPSHSDTDATFERLNWLEPGETPFGVRVLDCRPVAASFHSATNDPEAIRFFGTPESRSGAQFRGQHPEETIRVVCNLAYPLAASLPDGPLFLATTMEEKWNIYRFAGLLYFVRSWTGQLPYVARLADEVSELRVVEVEAWPGIVLGVDELAVRHVDFLIKSHVFGQVVPHPVPPLASKKGLALWSFSQYGRRGLFAAPEVGGAPDVGSAISG